MVGARLLPAALLIAAVGCSSSPGEGCETCTVERVPVVRLDFRNAPASPDLSPKILPRADAQGYLVAPMSRLGELFLFNPEGRYVRSIGRSGAGPEEHRRITALVQDAQDSVWVFDEGNQKVDVYDASLKHGRSLSVTGSALRAVAIPGDGFLLQGRPGNPELTGQHTWVLEREGSVRPFAAPAQGEEAPVGIQSLALEGSDAVWVVEGHRYSAVLLSLEGDTIRTVGTTPEWFTASPGADQFADLMDLRPAVLDIARSDEHVLWMMVGVPEEELPDPATLGQIPPDRILDLFIDHFLVALDSRSGAVLAEERFEYLPGSFVGPGLFATVEDDETGERWVQIYRLAVGR